MGTKDIVLHRYFQDDERLEPVVTIVLYYGTEPWSGATDLTELLNNEQIPTELQPFINHYPLHILQVRDYENAEQFQTDLKEVFLFLKYSENMSALKKLTTKYQEQYSSMDEDAYDVITALTNSKELETLKETNTEGGKVNMCNGLKGLIEEAVAEHSTAKAKTIAHNMFLRGMSQEDTAEICEENPELVKSWFSEWKS